EVHKKQVKQAEEEVEELAVERERLMLQIQHINTQIQQLMNPQEAAKQQSLSLNQVKAAVAEGIDLVSKVMYAIPELQAGVAGGFSSPLTTLQMGGQMFGDIASAFSTSIQKVMAKNETEADMAQAQAEYQRRRDEWQHQLDVLGKEKAQLDKRIAKKQLTLDIVN